MAKRPPNHLIGQARSRQVRSTASARVQRNAWHAIVDIAILYEPRTLRQFADRLNEWDVPTSRGGKWTPQLVQRVMAAHDTTAKKLTRRVTQPSIYDKRTDWPVEVYKAYRQRVEQIDTPSKATGEWLPATQHEPCVSDLVRHADYAEKKVQFGQVIGVKSASIFVCRFTEDDLTSTERECPAAELEVFRYDLSRAERIAKTEELREWFFRPNAREKP